MIFKLSVDNGMRTGPATVARLCSEWGSGRGREGGGGETVSWMCTHCLSYHELRWSMVWALLSVFMPRKALKSTTMIYMFYAHHTLPRPRTCMHLSLLSLFLSICLSVSLFLSLSHLTYSVTCWGHVFQTDVGGLDCIISLYTITAFFEFHFLLPQTQLWIKYKMWAMF